MVLDFLNEQLPWRSCKDNKVDEVRDIKAECLTDPQHKLWKTTTANLVEVKNIFDSLQKLQYGDKPDYYYIQAQLQQMLDRELNKTLTTKTSCSSKRKRKLQKEPASPVVEPAEVKPPIESGNAIKMPRLDDMPFPPAQVSNPIASLPPLIPPSYLSPGGYMMPPPGYPNMFYNFPFNQMMMPQMMGNRDEPLADEEQKVDPSAMQKPYMPFAPMMMPYSNRFQKDRIQFVSPNFININNVNTLGTALIINNGVPTKQVDLPAAKEAQKNQPAPANKMSANKEEDKERFFKVTVNEEYYRKLYTAPAAPAPSPAADNR